MDLTQRILEIAPSMNKEVIGLLQGEIKHVLTWLQWGLGACGAGFSLLLFLVLDMRSQVEKELKKDMDSIVKTLGEIKDALLGTFQHKGAISRLFDLEKEHKKLKDKVHDQ